MSWDERTIIKSLADGVLPGATQLNGTWFAVLKYAGRVRWNPDDLYFDSGFRRIG